MNLSIASSPAAARPGPLPAVTADATDRSTGSMLNSFHAELDHAFIPAGERAFARWRSPRGKAASDSGPEDSRKEPEPIEEEHRKGKEETPSSLAGACAVAPVHGTDHDFVQGPQRLHSTPATMDARRDALAHAGLTTESALVAPSTAEPTSAGSRASAKNCGELVAAAIAKLAVVETPDASSSVASGSESPSVGQTTAEESLSAGCRDLIEPGWPGSELASPIPADGSQAMPDRSTTACESPAALQKELGEGSTNFRGIAGAKVQEQMKNTAKQDEIAASTKQILPGTRDFLFRLARLDTRREARPTSVESVRAAALAGLVGVNGPLPITGTDLLPSDGLTGRLSRVDQMSRVISREVQIFKRTADESMEVVLTPDQNTQIALRLQWREGRVEILAHCHQGDYPALNTQWSQLQTALGHQGVRLAQLTRPAHTGYTEFFNSAGFTQSQNGGQKQSAPKVALDELVSTAVINPARKPPPHALLGAG